MSFNPSDFDPASVDPEAQLLDIDRCDFEESLYDFLKASWKWIDPAPWVDGWHIDAIAEHLQAVVDGKIRRLIINLPPRHCKSLLLSVAFPAWVWAQSFSGPTSGPGVPFVYASHNDKLSLRDSVKCRRLIESPFYQKLWGDRFRLVSDNNTKSRFSNDRGGERLITSIDAGITGEGGQIVAIDDPLAANDIASDAAIENVISWWTTAMPTRLNDPATGAYIIIMQRLAENDLTGYILENDIEGWCHLCYDDQTEILTQDRGWIPFTLLRIEDNVMGVDPMTLQGRWEQPTRIIRERFNGVMIHYKSQTADLCVTPDHRMVYADPNDIYEEATITKWRVRTAKDLPNDFYLPQVIRWTGSANPVMFGNRLWEPEIFAEFMGWYLSEGCASKKSRTTIIVQKGGSPGEVLIDEMMAKIPFHVGKYKNSKTMAAWQVKDRFLAAELGTLGNSLDKHAPRVLKDLAPQYLERFIICYARGDGHFARRNNLKITISSRSMRMIDDLQECAVKAGWATSATIEDVKNPVGVFPNGTARKPHVLYKLYVRASKSSLGRTRKVGSYIRGKHKKNTRLIPYNGMVHCVSVPSTAIVVRRNGRVSVSGNCLPGRYEPERSFHTVIGWSDPRTVPGQLLWPERFNEESLKRLEKTMGPWTFNGQIQQRPEPKGGGILKREWWKLWEADSFPPMQFILACLDTALTEDRQNDPSGMIVWGIYSGDVSARTTRIVGPDGEMISPTQTYSEFAPQVMMMWAWDLHLELHDLVEKVASTCVKMKVDTLLIESKTAGHSVAQEIRRLYSREKFGVELFDPKSQDKMARLYSVQHLFAEGIIHAPDRPWVEKVIVQAGQFPRGAHDEYVDLISMGLRKLRDMGLLVRQPERTAEVEADRQYRSREQPLYDV